MYPRTSVANRLFVHGAIDNKSLGPKDAALGSDESDGRPARHRARRALWLMCPRTDPVRPTRGELEEVGAASPGSTSLA